MKKTITTIFLTVFALNFAFSQEKGDNYLGLNFETSKNSSGSSGYETENTINSFGINYSTFIKENRRLNFQATYSKMKTTSQNSSTTELNSYGFGIGYGILFPLLKKFYAELTPGLNYSLAKNPNLPQDVKETNNSYLLNVKGGLLWVPLKHFGMSVNLATLSFGYSKHKVEYLIMNSNYEQTTTSFGFNNQGNFQDQSFSIFYKF